jgi:hypothetical protein
VAEPSLRAAGVAAAGTVLAVLAEASGVALVWLGFAPVSDGSALDPLDPLDPQRPLAARLGVAVCEFVATVAPVWPPGPLPDEAAPSVGVAPPFACVPLPSVPAPPFGGPPPPLSEELAWLIACRTG